MLRTTTAQGPAPTVFLSGEMDLDCAETLRSAIREAAQGAQTIVLDFGDVEFIDSSGTGVFVRLCLDLKSQGVPLVATNLSPAVRGVFEMLRVRELVGEDVLPDGRR
jgi:anti-anti-sigma factor